MTDSRSRVNLHQYDIRDVTFQLRRLGRREPYDVTGMTLRLTTERFETEAEDHLEPYVADPLHPDADFATGKVVFRVDRRLTLNHGSYRYALELEDPSTSEYFVLQTGRIEVKERPGFPGNFPIDTGIEISVVLGGTFVVT